MKYFIDRFERLWKGPINPDDTMHYARFEGYMTVTPFDPIWVLRRSSQPEDAKEVSEADALFLALLNTVKDPLP